MRLAYLDCFAGIAGDMFLGALIGAGVPAEVLHEATAALNLDASLKIETVDRSGISALKVHVLERGRPAESQPHEDDPHEDQPHDDLQHQHGAAFHTHPRTQHEHKTGHNHSHQPHASPETHEDPHQHAHVHGRALSDIRALIAAARLDAPVKAMAIHAFDLLGDAEARIHNVPVERIHFHEVGAVDAIVDIVACCAGVHYLGVGAWHASPVNVGGGMVDCAHGRFPVPAPATADLLRGVPTYSAHIEKELVTPTGAALLRALAPNFGRQPAMRVSAIGYGAGSRNPGGFPNVLRLSIGDASDTTDAQTVTVLETALDDSSPQLLAYVAEKALAAGALDVMLTPVIMKKGRPGTLLTVLCNPAESSTFEQLLLAETSTLGVRIRHDRRVCLERRHVAVDTPFGRIRMKLGLQAGEERNAAPEFEDCRAAAAQHGVPLKQVQQAAIAAYRAGAHRTAANRTGTV